MKVEQIVLPELRVASFRRTGPFGPGCAEAFHAVIGWACKNQVFNGSALVMGAYWDCPKTTAPEKCRMDACVTLSPGQNPALESGIEIQTLPGGLCATYLAGVHNNNFSAPWEELAAFLNEKKAERDSRPCYEIYYGPPADVHPLKKWVLDILVPLKSRFE
jgi:AraC family transcriptional regulator